MPKTTARPATAHITHQGIPDTDPGMGETVASGEADMAGVALSSAVGLGSGVAVGFCAAGVAEAVKAGVATADTVVVTGVCVAVFCAMVEPWVCPVVGVEAGLWVCVAVVVARGVFVAAAVLTVARGVVLWTACDWVGVC